MKIFHTADWHLGKLVQGVSMIEEQHYIMRQFIDAIKQDSPDAVIIAGDIYDRAIPPPEAVQLLNDVLDEIVIKLNIPVLAIAGNHDSPSRLHFGSRMMREKGFHIIGKLEEELEFVRLRDEYGEVHVHLVPYYDPSMVRTIFNDDMVKTHDDAAKVITEHIKEKMDENARHIYVGHAFVTPYGEVKENTSESERPLSIGGAEYVNANHFEIFHYTALGHLHQAHYVKDEKIRYAGSPLKYSISEEHHKKGFLVVELDEDGDVQVEKRLLQPRRDLRTVEAKMADLLQQSINEDYVFVRLLDQAPVLFPMEKVRSVYPNAMHVERKYDQIRPIDSKEVKIRKKQNHITDIDLFKAFYKEVKGMDPTPETEAIFKEVLQTFMDNERELIEEHKAPVKH